MSACENKDYDKIVVLLELGSSPGVVGDDEYTALHYVVMSRDINCLLLLLDYVVNIDPQCSKGWTPLMLACKKRDESMVKILVERGANINRQNYDGLTAMHVSCVFCPVKIIAYLYSKGGAVLQKDSKGITALDYQFMTPRRVTRVKTEFYL